MWRRVSLTLAGAIGVAESFANAERYHEGDNIATARNRMKDRQAPVNSSQLETRLQVFRASQWHGTWACAKHARRTKNIVSIMNMRCNSHFGKSK